MINWYMCIREPICVCDCASFCIVLLQIVLKFDVFIMPSSQNSGRGKLPWASGHFLSTIIESVFLEETDVVKHFC